MRTAKTVWATRPLLAVAISGALLALSACGDDDDDSPVQSDQQNQQNDNADNGGTAGGGDTGDGTTGGTDDGNTDGDGTGGNDGNGDGGDGNGTGDGPSEPDDGDIMQPMPGADPTTITLNCTYTVNGNEEMTTRQVTFAPDTLTLSVDGQATGIGPFAWSETKRLWVGYRDIQAGYESQHEQAYVTIDNIPKHYQRVLKANDVIIESLVCFDN